ncbi:MAG: hypothetical protein GY915_02885 [bacterium]|nr:hypothetical protein [bacterium]
MIEYIMTLDEKETSTITFEDILKHRISFIQSEQKHLKNKTGQDELDTDQTTYLAYQDDMYGLVGVARIVSSKCIPPYIQSALPSNQKITFLLGDCLFHVPEGSTLFDLPEENIKEHFSRMKGGFYAALSLHLENQAVFRRVPFFYFLLRKESIQLIRKHIPHEVTVLKEFNDFTGRLPQHLGFLDFSEVLLKTGEEKKA